MNITPRVDVVDLKCINPNFDARFRQDYGDLSELITNIKQFGLIQPLAVIESDDGTYYLLAGGRRVKACIEAGIETVPVRIYPNNIDDFERLAIELSENVLRKDQTWQERAALVKRIHSIHIERYGLSAPGRGSTGWRVGDTAEFLGMSQASISNCLQAADSLEAIPELSVVETQTAALKLLNKLEADELTAELARRAEERESTEPDDLIKSRLHSWYKLGNFFTGIKGVSDRIVHLVEIDPPYAVGLENVRIGTPTTVNEFKDWSKEEFINLLDQTIAESVRVMRDHAWLILWFGWGADASDEDFVPVEITRRMLLAHDLKVPLAPALWIRPQSQTSRPEFILPPACEGFWYARKGAPAIVKQGHANVFFHGRAKDRVHPTEKPVELIQEILETFLPPSCIVMSPFLGSGNTLLACSNTKMHGFGFELEETYRNGFISKVEAGKPGEYKSLE